MYNMFMAKKRKYNRKKKSSKKAVLPNGFWAQVFAVVLIIGAILNVLTWFRAGGPLLDQIQKINLQIFGYGVFVLPIALSYLAYNIFKEEDNKLPWSTYLSTLIFVFLFSGLFGLLVEDSEMSTGGLVGDLLNNMMKSLVIEGVAVFLYFVLISITILFMTRVSPFELIKTIKGFFSKAGEQSIKGLKTTKKPANSDFELVAGVPTTSSEEEKPEKRPKIEFKAVNNSISSKPKDLKQKEEPTALVSIHDPNWQAPPIKYLGSKQSPADAGNVEQNAETIRNTLHEFNIDVQMTGANIGPKVTQYTLSPPSGVKLTKIAALENNIALNLAAESLRIEAPIPGKRAVGIEVPNVKAADVRIRSIMESSSWRNSSSKLSFVVGRDIAGKEIVEDLSSMPHLLIAGQTGSGKSVMINTLLTSLLYRNSPSDLKLILVDPKQVEMAPYEDIPHLITPIITDSAKTISALKWAVNEMERRYKLLASEKKRDIISYNNYIKERDKTVEMTDEEGNVQEHKEGAMPYIVIVIDEMADLMMVASRDVETLISRIAAKARAVGIHLVLATQRPSVNVVTGLIKANVPARIAFTVASQIDSRTILDQVGAEKLLGKGDMLITTTKITKPYRIQGALVTDDEVLKVTDYLRMQMPPQYNEEIVNQDVDLGAGGGVVGNVGSGGAPDAMMIKAAEVFLQSGRVSVSSLQTKLGIGYNRAARIVNEMEERGIVSQPDASRKRKMLISSVEEMMES